MPMRNTNICTTKERNQINLLCIFDVFSIDPHTVEISLSHEYGLVLT
jgi:hypothetical protein